MASRYSVNVAIAPMDSACRETLAKMLANGWTAAQTLCQTSQQDFVQRVESPAQAWRRHRRVGADRTLESFTVSQWNAQSGTDVDFDLNVNLI